MKCFISYDFKTDVSKIKETLELLNIDVLNYQREFATRAITELVHAAIKESDFVLAVLSKDNRNILYELGVANGLNKKVFAVYRDEIRVPSYLEGIMKLKTDFNYDTTVLRLSLDNFVRDMRKRSRPASKKSPKVESKQYSESEINKIISDLNQTTSEEKIINFLMEILSSNRIKAVSEMQIDTGLRADIAIANNNSANYLGNPIILEVKRGSFGKRKLHNILYQIEDFKDKSGAQLGLLITQVKISPEDIKGLITDYNTLIFTIEEFAFGVLEYGFEKFLIGERNKIKHNIG